MPRITGGSSGGGFFLMGEVPLYSVMRTPVKLHTASFEASRLAVFLATFWELQAAQRFEHAALHTPHIKWQVASRVLQGYLVHKK